VCRLVRRRPKNRDLPILMLTARAQEADKLRGLDGGADDYLTKPFSLPELMARLRALLRRARPVAEKGRLRLDDIEMDLSAHRVARDGRTVDLGPTEFRLLRFLLEHPKRVFSREELLDAVWGPDIHVEPQPDSLRIRYRIDGFLHEIPVPENIKSLQASVIARIKVMSKLDIAEKRLPQDGRINLKAEGQSIDVRVACIPSVEGESMSLRLLGQERFTLDRLGLSEELRERIEVLLTKPNGIVLVTGPTGSGKSTTLYTFLSQLNSVHRRIVTIEDPVENKLPGIVQIPVKNEIGLTFASGLRSILRGDPNVVMVGEIRDLETAEIAVRASLTGHLVFSTLHTNDAVAGITRLIEMGVKPFLVSSAVRAFIAQRLVRCLCSACKEPANYKREDFLKLGFPEAKNLKLYRAARGGCQQCRGTGYSGRVALYEIALMTPTMQTLVSERASEADLQAQARKDGFVPMREYGLKKAAAGVTTLEEVARVTSEEFE
jgi:type II secretory ATPase GspE/PulE/Tfp pilus assembly ATPase PilB-like protein